MAELTKEEARWVKRVQKALDACPTDRIGFYTIGDVGVTLYDIERVKGENDQQDFCQMVENADAELGELNFPNLVHSTAG